MAFHAQLNQPEQMIAQQRLAKAAAQPEIPVIKIETTDLEGETVEIAAYDRVSGTLRAHAYVMPAGVIHPAAQNAHGLTRSVLAERNALPIDQAWPNFRAQFEAAFPNAAHVLHWHGGVGFASLVRSANVASQPQLAQEISNWLTARAGVDVDPAMPDKNAIGRYDDCNIGALYADAMNQPDTRHMLDVVNSQTGQIETRPAVLQYTIEAAAESSGVSDVWSTPNLMQVRPMVHRCALIASIVNIGAGRQLAAPLKPAPPAPSPPSVPAPGDSSL